MGVLSDREGGRGKKRGREGGRERETPPSTGVREPNTGRHVLPQPLLSQTWCPSSAAHAVLLSALAGKGVVSVSSFYRADCQGFVPETG